ncbi:hypothetical protein M6B38_215905 [Iris pallida]|uniref:Uncharacterized protein n=1 Tax=Iris pallida TaxID=29817 RepID=A0AAX6E0N1_IRIPA|nr:hypothetical protein M6B38_215905 [Iris pallida]
MRRRRRISAGSGWVSVRVRLTVQMAADRGGLAAVGDAPIRRRSNVREAAHGRPERRRPSASALADRSGETAAYAWHPQPAVFSSAHHDNTDGVGRRESEASVGGRLGGDARARLCDAGHGGQSTEVDVGTGHGGAWWRGRSASAA